MAEARCALIIASYEYEDTDLSRLVAPAQDAEALARVLSDPLIGGFQVETLVNQPSYLVNPAIESFFTERKRDDTILLYFSGHGIKDEEGRLYFATTDTRRQRLRTTAIPATLVNDVMRYSRSRRQVLLLDCCYSGAFARGMVVRADQVIGTGEYFKEARGQAVLTASDALQYSFEGDQIKGEGVTSVFTHTLVHGLETGEADLDGDGHISFDELYEYVYDRITDQVPQQQPRKWVFDVQGEIVLARNPRPVVKPSALPLELQQSIQDLRPWVREGAVQQLGRLLQSSDRELARAAQAALTNLADDDSRSVSDAAAKTLTAFAEAQRPVEVERQVEPLPAEQAQRRADQPPVEPLAPEPAPPVARQEPVERAWSWQRLGLPLALVALLGLVIGAVAIGLLGRAEEPTPAPTEVASPVPESPAAAQPPPTASLLDSWQRPSDGMWMVYVPGGTFEMGSADGDADEQPVHSVTLDPFWIDQTEVTNAQYASCVAAGACRPPSQPSSSTSDSYYGDSQYAAYPVMQVSWNDATTYCAWAGGRLPSEAEWEYAARGPDGLVYPWGNDPPDHTVANYGDNIGHTTPVGAYPQDRSWVGALDMAGNVSEWVIDWYGSYPSEPQVNPTGHDEGEDRVIRGGRWNFLESRVRASYRDSGAPDLAADSVGLRCVVEARG